MCLVFRDSQLSAGFFTEPLVACKSRASTDYRASPWENRQRRKYACLQRNLSFFAVHVSLPCLVHPTLLENPKRPRFAWRFFGTRKAPRSPERLWCALVEYEIERLLLMTTCCSLRRTAVIPAGVCRKWPLFRFEQCSNSAWGSFRFAQNTIM